MTLEQRVEKLEKEVAELNGSLAQPEEAVVVRERIVHEKVLSNGYRQVSIITDPTVIEKIKLAERS